MKFTLELNAHELRETIRTGLLDAVACLETQETSSKEAEPVKAERPAASAVPTTVPPRQEPTPQAAAIPQQAQPAQTPQDPAAAQATQAAPAAVPVQAVSYTMEQLALAATQLMDANKKQAVLDLLAKYGVQALTMLPKEQYGAFATDLRALGAKL